jgi:L-fuconolactonase
LQQIIDTHIHAWNFEKAAYPWLDGNTSLLNRTYHIEEIEQERKDVNISGGVLVQASNNTEDTDWMLEVAAASEWIKGVVGWLPLMDPAGTRQLLEEKYLKNQYFRGVRHLIHDEADPKWLLQPSVLESLQTLASFDISYDVVGVLPEHIRTVLAVAEKVPGLRMIFDHLNQPPIPQNERFGDWGSLMKTAAGHQNFYVKISGLGTTTGKTSGWDAADIKPYVEFALEQFGAGRCCCGGDWPVSLLAGSYKETWMSYIQVINELTTGADREKIFFSNAQHFYKLKFNQENHGGN